MISVSNKYITKISQKYHKFGLNSRTHKKTNEKRKLFLVGSDKLMFNLKLVFCVEDIVAIGVTHIFKTSF